jgi:hypothetical protein
MAIFYLEPGACSVWFFSNFVLLLKWQSDIRLVSHKYQSSKQVSTFIFGYLLQLTIESGDFLRNLASKKLKKRYLYYYYKSISRCALYVTLQNMTHIQV